MQELQSGGRFNIFPSRTEQLQRYRNNKHSTFLKELRNRSSSINKNNIRIFERLAGTTDVIRSGAEAVGEISAAYTPSREPRKRKQ